MSSIDQRVVHMLFDNQQFEQGISTTLGSLEKLNKGLKLDGATKGLNDVASAAKGFSLEHIASSVEGIAGKFRAMSIVGVTALTNIANKALNVGLSFAKSVSVGPVIAGLHEYETNLNAIQTVMANTGLTGSKGLAKVNDALNQLNTYSDKTIYNFSEMAKNIGTFTAAGVDLKTSTAAIKGIANLAAVSGSNADQASTAMYQLSQALAAGRVSLQDWNSVVNAGMGGKVFQQALMETARVHGVAIDSMVKKQGGFRNTLQKGWLTSKILTETLNKFTGDLNATQLKGMGYSKQQIADIIKMGKTAQDAATKVKTMSQLIDTLKEAVGSGWTKTWSILFGDFNEARTLFTNVSNVLGGFVSASANARNKVLGDWKALGGRTALIDGIANAFHALISILKPIRDAFREIFPATTGKQLYDLTVNFRNFMERLKLGPQTAENLRRTFAGFFAVLGIGWEIIKAVAKAVASLFSSATQGSGGILKFTAQIGDFLVALHTAIVQGDGLTRFFKQLVDLLIRPIKFVQQLAGQLGNMFGSFNGAGAAKSVTSFTTSLNPLDRIMGFLTMAGNKLASVMDVIWAKTKTLGSTVISFFSGIGQSLSGSVSGIDFGKVLGVINTGLFAGLLLLLKSFIAKFRNQDTGLAGIVTTIKDSFEQLTKTLSSMQQTLKAATLLEIAAAIGLLTISVVALSKIDSAGLQKALIALAVMFTELFASLAIFNKVAGSGGFGKMILVSTALILLATAVDILTIAVANLSKLSWNELSKGLTGVAVLLLAIAGAVKLMSSSKGMISTSLGILAISAAINILVGAVTNLSGLSWQDMAKGLTGVAVLLASLALFTRFSAADKGGVLQGAGIILLAVGIKILAGALKDFAKMSWQDIGKGLTAMAGGLTLIAGALYLIPPSALLSAAGVIVVAASLKMIGDAMKSMAQMSWQDIGKGLTVMAGALLLIGTALYLIPPTALLSAAGVLVVAASLSLISDALKSMAQMSWQDIGKGLTVLTGALGVIAGALMLMEGALPGAAALLIVVASLLLLLPVLKVFSQMSWEEIGKGLTMLAGVFVVLGLAGLILAPIVPVLLGLGAAIVLLGIGLLATGAGVFLFAGGLTALAVAGTAGAAAMVAIVVGLIGLIPTVMKQIGLGIIAFADAISTAGPAITKAIVTVLGALLDAIGTMVPKIVTTLLKLVVAMYNALADNVPKMVNAGLRLVTGVLNGIAKNIGGVVTAATNVIVNFLNGIAKNLPRVIQAGANLIIKFINGVADAIRKNGPALGDAGGNLASSIIEGMIKGLGNGIGKIASKAGSIAQSAIDAAKGILNINSPSKEFIKIGQSVNEGFLIGLEGNKSQIDAAFKNLRDQLSNAMNNSARNVATLESRLTRLTSARHKDRQAINDTRTALAQARKEHALESAAYADLTKRLTDEKNALDKLATQYDTVTNKLKAAQATLANAKKTRDDFNKSIKDQFSTLPAIAVDTKVSTFETDLKKQIEKTKEFANALQRLRKLGLSDKMYKDLLAQGADALPFAQELLAGGRNKVAEVNSLGNQLDQAAASLGKSASSALYQAAVDSAAGLVKGLQNQQAAIEKQMDKIAAAMVNSIKKALGIRSPSTVFAEVGGYSMDGLIKGMESMSDAVGKSAAGTGQTAVDSLRKSLSGFSDLITSDITMRPTITPVLDLTNVKKDAGKIGGMFSSQSISVDGAYTKAAYVASGYMSNQATSTQQAGPTKTAPVTYNQYNTSPKALSPGEIYRQTKNQLSVAKGALQKP